MLRDYCVLAGLRMLAVASGFSKFTEHENHRQNLLIHKLWDLMPRESDSVGLGCSCLRIGIFKFPDNGNWPEDHTLQTTAVNETVIFFF